MPSRRDLPSMNDGLAACPQDFFLGRKAGFGEEGVSVILNEAGLGRTIVRLAHEIAERNGGTDGIVLVGVKRGGEVVANRLREKLHALFGCDVPCAGLDIGMTRDDLVSAFFVPSAERNELGFSLEGKKVVLCDDVLHTGRSALAAIEALFRLGRPAKIELLVLVDRGGREVPVGADFVGKNVPMSRKEYVTVRLRELGAPEDSLAITREIP